MRSSISLALSIILFPIAANANSLTSNNSDFEFSFIEGTFFDAELGIEHGAIDNFLNQSDGEQSSRFSELSSQAFIQMLSDRHLLQASGALSRFLFDKFDEDDHTETEFKSKYFFKLSDSHTLSSSIALSNNYEYRGTGSTKGTGSESVRGREFTDTLFNVGYRYGRLDSVSRVLLLVGKKRRGYEENNVFANTLDNEALFAQAGVDYLISGKTYFSTSIEFEDVEYISSPEQNRRQIALLAGIKWEPSEQSQFTALLGYESLAFEQDVFNDEDLFKWRISYRWTPLERFTMNIKSGRASKTSIEQALNYNVVDTHSLGANYAITPLLHINASIQYNDEETIFVGSVINEQYFNAITKVNYEINHRFDVHLTYQSTSVESDRVINEYDKNQISLGVIGKF